LRLTDIEFELVTQTAREAGLSSSAYIRKLLLEGQVSIKYELVADIPELQKLTAEFGKIGNNLNQIARYFHTGGIRSKAMQDEIHECISQLFALRKEVIQMAGDYHGSIETHRK
ncbi:MAG: plasmid mobilization relaxosome protein MobC, partial [Lachnospiraceae bacterium]|nr:plasmid mobilization relaxosome protein MobC [Lachnospiraceae bacterium]